MNFKKFVSGVSALTIAASAFVGLAVTAEAMSDKTFYFIGDAYGVETFTGYTDENWTTSIGSGVIGATANGGNDYLKLTNITEVAKPAVGETAEETPTYVSGDVLTLQKRGGGDATATYTLTTDINNGDLYFSGDLYSQHTFSASPLIVNFYNDAGSKVAYMKIENSSAAYMRVYNGNGTASARTNGTTNNYTSIPVAGIHFSIQFKYSNKHILSSFDYINASGVRTQETLNEITLQQTDKSEITTTDYDIKSIEFVVSGGSSINRSWSLDNAMLYAVMPTADAYNVSFAATDTDDSTALNPTVTVYSDVAKETVVSDLTAVAEGATYYYTATLAGYETKEGSFELPVSPTANPTKTVEFTMIKDTRPVETVRAVYKYNGTTVKTIDLPFESGITVGTAYDNYYSNNYIYGDDGKWYYISVDYNSDVASQQLGNATPSAATNNNALVKSVEDVSSPNYVITYDVAGIASNVVSFIEGEDLTTGFAYTGHRYKASGGKVASFNNRPTFYNVTESGTYQITVATRANGRHTSVFKTEAEAAAATYVAETNETPYTAALLDVAGNNNGEYGSITTKTVDLENGNVLTLRGYSWNNGKLSASSGNDIDYIVIRKLTNTVTTAAGTNGTVESDVEYAKPGDTVTLTVTPDANYAADTVSVNGTPISPVAGVYSFTMPDAPVTVTATFVSTYTPASVTEVERVDFGGMTSGISNGDGVFAAGFKFTLNPNDQTITTVKVMDTNTKVEKAKSVGSLSGSTVTFGIIAVSRNEASISTINPSDYTITVQ